ncbi:(2Fe-2S) ferredoxin domain-containing protein [Oscillatoria sp. FACHB-1406]|uniref:(2Fe-2S) ferredoxin domain-containing protein n=1 Tax=Oscillatoria sp. FACHB-1406 TaxID=2692846 RepID=UPI0016849279|nr:(2Fe-2S) ferredoxin domain-containing protein [Oscillatoria sp. FACHB-1406]MBD2576909.1 (2Fe-2S) ferredoxin domain-containing protein [Oscillatoria sp. FACHB-1406]
MLTAEAERLQFACTGQLLDFIVQDKFKVKYLRVVLSGREHWVKLSKQARKTLDSALVPGCWLEIVGRKKICKKTGQSQLKADFVQRIPAPSAPETPACVPQARSVKAETPKTKILVCKKSDCAKQGGEAVCGAIARYLRDYGLEDSVEVKMTGCLKQCKKGPNLVVMPDKTHYTKIAPREIPALLDKHCRERQETPTATRTLVGAYQS